MQSERREQRSPLGLGVAGQRDAGKRHLGPLEAAIMRVLWDTDTWLTIRDVRDRMDYAAMTRRLQLCIHRSIAPAG
jgi:hypothetical protein